MTARQIAAGLRSQIASGTLAAGARLPSTRALAQQHGVAPATAAHALRILATEGLAKPVARIGNIVVGVVARAVASPRTADVVRDDILRAGIQIADEEGLAALSIRGVAAKVGVAPMSLYRHVATKHELVLAMADAAVARERLPKPARTWRGELEQCARLQWQVFKRHPWLGRVLILTRPTAMPHTLALADRVLKALAHLGFTAADAMRIHIVLHGFVQGIAVNLEAESEALGESGITDEAWLGTQVAGFAQLSGGGKLPHLAAVLAGLASGFELDFDELFETGLRLLLDGLARRAAA